MLQGACRSSGSKSGNPLIAPQLLTIGANEQKQKKILRVTLHFVLVVVDSSGVGDGGGGGWGQCGLSILCLR